MHKSLVVNKKDLEDASDDWEYLYILLDKYAKLQNRDPENRANNFNNEQHSLMAYTTLDAQVANGGFIQLIYNGYGAYVFESPLIENLKVWGLNKTAKLLEKVSKIYIETKISQEEDDTLEDFSDLYTDYPQFEEYDNTYYNINDDEVKLVKAYVENNLNKFITVEE